MKTPILFIFLLLVSAVSAQKLHLYGGSNHDVYLGCLNCSKTDSNSIWNDLGKYGSANSSMSIWNDFGTYGNPMNSLSPWNDFASKPPIVVDASGKFCGYFTVDKSHHKRAEFELALLIYNNYQAIRKDVSTWYRKLF